MKFFFRLPKGTLLFLIAVYKKTLSPDHGFLRFHYPYGYCRYHPTCSEYAYQSIKKYGVWKGIGLAFRRILRCNPWSQGGLDPVK